MSSTMNVFADPGFLQMAFSSSAWTSWSQNIIVLGLISFLAVVLLHMISIAFNMPSLKAWVKGEYMQVIATYILVFASIGLVMFSWNLMVDMISKTYYATEMSQGIPQGASYDPFSFVQSFIKTTMIECEQNIYKTLYSINFFFKIVGSTKTETMGVEPVGGWYSTVYTSFFEYLMDNISLLLLLHWVQIRMLSVIKYTAPLIIQLGLILRVFPMSRGAGGLLLAVGFGFFAIYPISLAVLVTLQSPGVSFCTDFVPPATLNIEEVGEGIDAGTVVWAYYASKSNESEVVSLFNKAKTFLTLFYMQAVFFPMVALIITFTFIRQTGSLLGSDLNEIGRGLVKLI